jgi:3-oxoacyl-[acyl-carrier protein] reductase
MRRLEGKVAVVTGASKGIGAAIARAYAAEGASVVVNYSSSKVDADKVVAAIVARDGKAVAVHADVSKAADVKRLFEETQKAFGRLDVLVNNAGIYEFAPIEAVTEEDFHRLYNVNVLGPLLAIQTSLKYFGPEGGSIVNVSTAGTRSPPPASSVYVSSKAALEAITKVLAKELGPRKIRINSLSPGPVQTEGTSGFVDSEFMQNMVKATPFGRIGQPEDLGRAALFLATEDSSWVTGETVLASGGL